ncbi:MAG: hypothetical protein GXO23_07370 [Crenarchaeota archaeon]|nr:hypothetical protein [Thermoproteota archaeon]
MLLSILKKGLTIMLVISVVVCAFLISGMVHAERILGWVGCYGTANMPLGGSISSGYSRVAATSFRGSFYVLNARTGECIAEAEPTSFAISARSIAFVNSSDVYVLFLSPKGYEIALVDISELKPNWEYNITGRLIKIESSTSCYVSKIMFINKSLYLVGRCMDGGLFAARLSQNFKVYWAYEYKGLDVLSLDDVVYDNTTMYILTSEEVPRYVEYDGGWISTIFRVTSIYLYNGSLIWTYDAWSSSGDCRSLTNTSVGAVSHICYLADIGLTIGSSIQLYGNLLYLIGVEPLLLKTRTKKGKVLTYADPALCEVMLDASNGGAVSTICYDIEALEPEGNGLYTYEYTMNGIVHLLYDQGTPIIAGLITVIPRNDIGVHTLNRYIFLRAGETSGLGFTITANSVYEKIKGGGYLCNDYGCMFSTECGLGLLFSGFSMYKSIDIVEPGSGLVGEITTMSLPDLKVGGASLGDPTNVVPVNLQIVPVGLSFKKTVITIKALPCKAVTLLFVDNYDPSYTYSSTDYSLITFLVIAGLIALTYDIVRRRRRRARISS